MFTKLFANMFFILFLCPVLLVAGVQTLTIDTQLGTSVEDCFERVSIGEHLPRDAIYRNVSELTTRECEQICKQDKQCQSYDYGVGAKGNATCNLSKLNEKEIKEKSLLYRNPDYDVYVRRLNCEQSPPTPIQGQFNDPEEGPAHKPVFRPEDDEKRPLSDDVHDSRPYETVRPDLIKPIPPYRPHRPNDPYRPNRPNDPYRPDDYSYQKPNYNAPPVYGDHKPIETPYRPPRPSYMPDPYDHLYFRPIEDKPYRPNNPALYRPDPVYQSHYPEDIPDLYGPKPIPKPPVSYIPEEKPLYHYIIRPNRKPLTQIPRPDDFGYGHPPKPDLFEPLGPPLYHGPTNHLDPHRPDDYFNQKPSYNVPPTYGDHKPIESLYRPIRPNEKPSYNYDSIYASNYGSNYDNSIHVEIVDPPRPYKPSKPTKPPYSQNYFGFGSDESTGYGVTHHGTHHEMDQGGYGQHQSSYGHESHNQSGTYGNRPQSTYGDEKPQPSYEFQRPGKPSYYEPPTPSYINTPGSSSIGYGHQKPEPSYGLQKPSYNEPVPPSYLNNHGSTSTGYGHQKPETSYPNQKPSYNELAPPSFGFTSGGYGQQKPHDYYSSHRPSYDDDYLTYGVTHKPSHHEEEGSYGHINHHGYEPYGNSRPGYGHTEESYDYRPSYNRPSYGHDNNLGGYNNHDKFDTQRPGFGHEHIKYPSTSYHKPLNGGYNQNQNENDYHKPQKPIYSTPSYEGTPHNYNQSFYGEKPSHSTTHSHVPVSATAGYGIQEEDTKNSGYNKPSNTSGHKYPENYKPVYEYELDKPHNVPSYVYRPNGDIVTSRPVSIGDYGGDVGRGPGYVPSYKGE